MTTTTTIAEWRVRERERKSASTYGENDAKTWAGEEREKIDIFSRLAERKVCYPLVSLVYRGRKGDEGLLCTHSQPQPRFAGIRCLTDGSEHFPNKSERKICGPGDGH